MRVIVTGGAGFIGSAMCRFLAGETDSKVLNVDKLNYAAKLNSLNPIADNPNYSFTKSDICDRMAMDRVFDAFCPDAVVNLAAESHVDRSITDSKAFIDSNISGTYTLLEAARAYWSALPLEKRKKFRFLQISTDEVYGSLGAVGLFKETTSYDPSSPYSASKAAADHLVLAWHRTYGLPTMISNCSNNYGPYQFPEKLIPLMIINALEGKPLAIYGDGKNVRDWLYVDDHVRALYLILCSGQPGEKYNVGGSSEQTNICVVSRICEIMNNLNPSGAPHDRLITFVKDRLGHDRRYAIDATKINSELGWRAREDFDSGLEKTVRWYLQHRDWWQPLRDEVYGGHRLGLVEEARSLLPEPTAP